MNESSSVPNQEINALHDFYNALHGENWIWKNETLAGKIWNFTEPVDPCDHWQGLLCESISNTTQVITFVNLYEYNLTGTIPESFSNLTYLSQLYLAENSIHGTIPKSICSFQYLKYVGLSGNQLDGPIWNCTFQNLTALAFIALTNNRLTGRIPEFSPALTNLTVISLYENKLFGPIPQSITSLSSLSRLYLGYNFLSGTVNHLAQLTSLERLALNNNQFDGTISEDFSSLTKLSYLYLYENMFHGPLPSLQNCHNMTYLTFSSNAFTGSIPLSFEVFTPIISFYLSDNFISGTLENSVFQHWNSSQEFGIFQNFLSGRLPSAWSHYRRIGTLLLQENLFSGNPSNAFNSEEQISLEEVDLSNNLFTGTIPHTLWGPSLVNMFSFMTCFHGSIPEEICHSVNLQTIDFDGITSNCAELIWGQDFPNAPKTATAISGGIPSCVWELQYLTSLTMSSNGLTGTIPSLERYGNLSYLDLSFNSLTGTIPSGLQRWSRLYHFNLQNNRLTGGIDDIGGLNYSYSTASSTTENSLTVGAYGIELTLSINRLSGSIPSQLYSAYNIDILEGNLFSCSQNNPPPIHDPNTDYYVCGSNLLDVSLYLFVPAGLATLCFYFGLFLVIRSLQRALLRHQSDAPRRFDYVEEGNISCSSSKDTKPLDTSPGIHTSTTTTTTAATAWYRCVDFIRITAIDILDSICYSVIELQERIHQLQNPSHPPVLWSYLWGKLQLFFYSLLLWHAHALQLRHSYEELIAVNGLQQRDLQHLRQFLLSLQVLRRIIVMLAAFILICALPIYGILKTNFGTYSTQYNWYVSGMFLSGYQPVIFFILMWLCMISFSLWMIRRGIPTSLSHEENINSNKEEDSKQSSSADDEATSRERASTLLTGRFSVLSSKVNGSNPSTRESMAAILIKQVGLEKVQKKSFWVSMLALLINAAIIVFLKTAFLLLLISSNTSVDEKILIELGISVIDLSWGAFMLPVFIQRLPDLSTSRKMFLKTYMLFMNSWVVPILILLVSDAACFNGLFVNQSQEVESFVFDSCLVYGSDDNPSTPTNTSANNSEECMVTSVYRETQYFTPTFSYNYDCYSTILIAYIPIFLITYMILSLLIPLGALVLLTRDKPWTILTLFPGVFYISEMSDSEHIQNKGEGENGKSDEISEKRDEKAVVQVSIDNPIHLASRPTQQFKPFADPSISIDDQSHRSPASSTSSASTVSRQLQPNSRPFFSSISSDALSQLTASTDQHPTSKDQSQSQDQLSEGKENGQEKSPQTGSPRANRAGGGGRALIYPEFILSSATNHLLFMLTFGLMAPALAVAIGFVTVTTTYFWEILIGRYLRRESVRYQRSHPHRGVSERKDRNPNIYRAPTSLKRLDQLCEAVCCAPRHLMSFLTLTSAVFFALIVIDVAGDQQGWLIALWAPMSFVFLSFLLLMIFNRPDPFPRPASFSQPQQVIQSTAAGDAEQGLQQEGQEQRDTISRQLSTRFSSFEIERPPTISGPIKIFS